MARNSKIVIEVIYWRYINYSAKVCEWLAESSISLAEMTFLAPGEVFISMRSSFYFWQGNKKITEFSTRFVFLLDYTRYQGECIHIARRGWLNLAKHNDWPSGGLIRSLGECFILREVQAMSVQGITLNIVLNKVSTNCLLVMHLSCD